MLLTVKNIGFLTGTYHTPPELLKGREMQQLPVTENAWLICEDGLFHSWGPMSNWEAVQSKLNDHPSSQIIDANGGMLSPAWCDSHTHIVYAGPRETEFVDRIKGLTYEEIARRGGGILNSAKKLAEVPEEILLEDAMSRLHEMIRFGTGAVEIKSGYGLSLDAEIKMLRVIKKLKSMTDIPVKATFLGAHAVPAEYRSKRSEYIDLIVERMLPAIADEGLADFCDVFCDRGFFTVEETDRILEAGWKHHLQPKIHANELDFSGGIQVGVRHRALSVDHLEFTGDDEISVLLNSSTMPTILPSTAFFLKLHYAPARKMIDSGLPVALATDYNPGSSPSGNMPFVLSLACIYMGMLPEEAINAATVNSAYAMGVGKTNGSIVKGRPASFFITEKISSPAQLPYSFGRSTVLSTFINGKKFN